MPESDLKLISFLLLYLISFVVFCVHSIWLEIIVAFDLFGGSWRKIKMEWRRDDDNGTCNGGGLEAVGLIANECESIKIFNLRV